MNIVANTVTNKVTVLIIKQEIYFTVKLQKQFLKFEYKNFYIKYIICRNLYVEIKMLIYLFLNIIHHMMFLKVTSDYFCKRYVLYRKAKRKVVQMLLKKKL